LSREGVCDDISFDLKYGEVLGIAGLVGAGRTEIMRCIFGLDKKDTGTIMIEGKECDIKSPSDAIKLGIGFVTEDRKMEGLVLGMSVGQNITMSILERLCKLNFINDKQAVDLAKQYIERLSIRTPSYKQIVKNLSGGNQQKVVIAKWLLTQPKVLILDEPTRGIDVGAKNEIYKLMNQLSERGIGIIMISSELPEILRMSDRILVIKEGRITASFDGSKCSQESIMKHAL
jgi:ribose transport system ATP-binding protein